MINCRDSERLAEGATRFLYFATQDPRVCSIDTIVVTVFLVVVFLFSILLQGACYTLFIYLGDLSLVLLSLDLIKKWETDLKK